MMDTAMLTLVQMSMPNKAEVRAVIAGTPASVTLETESGSMKVTINPVVVPGLPQLTPKPHSEQYRTHNLL